MQVRVAQLVADHELVFAHLCEHGSHRVPECMPPHTLIPISLNAGWIFFYTEAKSSGLLTAPTLMLLANVRGGVNSLMADHMMGHEKSPMPSVELAEDLIGLVRAYLK